MFKKAQLRLFATITAILLAIFIAVLGSINVIMQVVMQRQSRAVLKQIASGVEYDDETSTFAFMRFEGSDRKFDRRFNDNNNNNGDEPPPKPEDEQTTVASSTDETESSETTSEEAETSQETEASSEEKTVLTEPEMHAETEHRNEENPPPEQQEEQPHEEEPAEEPTEQQVIQPESQSPAEEPTEEVPTEIYPSENVFQNPEKNNEERGGYWENPRGWERGGEDRRPEFQEPNPDWGWGGWNMEGADIGSGYCYDDFEEYEQPVTEGVMQTAYSTGSVLDGYTILNVLKDDTNTQPTESSGQFPDSRDRQGEPFEQGQYKPDGGLNNTQNGEPVPKTLGSIDFFVVMSDPNGAYLSTLNNDDLDESTAQSYITAILDDGAETGMINNYQFYQMDKSNGTLMVFTDKSDELRVLKQLRRTTAIIGIITVIVLSIVGYFLSKKSIEPIKQAFDKQKQFISDASHELKTPLTVISTNADVLAGEIGENKWLNYIKSQTERMNVLVNDLLNLTRIENNTSNFIITEFNLSQAITNTALPFECRAFESGKKFIVDVEDGLTVSGSEMHIKQMAAIFIDNALKYAKDEGLVRVTLKKQGDKKVFSVYNTGKGVKDEEVDKIFERFYRSDESRNRATGGYGLGLAIAKSIIDKHKFKINVENAEGKSICFVVTM